MKEQEKSQFVDLLHQVMSLYGKTTSDFMLGVFWTGLKSYPLSEVRQALHAHCTNPDIGAYAPKPCDVIRYLSGTTQERAALAWSKVQEAVARMGAYRCVVFDDAVIHRVIRDMGGWVKLCRSTEQTLHFLGQDFQKRYSSYASRQTKLPYPRVLSGCAAGKGEQPAFVGDKALAEQVYAEGESTSSTPTLSLDEIQQIQRNLADTQFAVSNVVALDNAKGGQA